MTSTDKKSVNLPAPIITEEFQKLTITQSVKVNKPKQKRSRINSSDMDVSSISVIVPSTTTPPLSPVREKVPKKKKKTSNKDLLSKHLSKLQDEGRSVTQTITGKETKEELFKKKSLNASLQPKKKVFGPDALKKQHEFPHLSPQEFRNVSLFGQKVNAANKKWRQDKISHKRMAKYLSAEPQSLLSVDLNMPEMGRLTDFLQSQAKTLKGGSVIDEFMEFKNNAVKGFDTLIFSIDQICLVNGLVAVYNCTSSPNAQNGVYLGFSLFWAYLQFGSRMQDQLSILVKLGMKKILKITGSQLDVVEPQIAVEDISEFSTLTTVMLSMWTNMYLPSAKLPRALLDQLTNFDRTKSSLSSIMTFVLTRIQKLMDWISATFEVQSPFAFVTSNEEKYRSSIKAARAIIDKFNSGTMVFDEQNFERVSRISSEIEGLLLKIPRQHKETMPMVELLKEVDRNIKKVYLSFISQNFQTSGYRQEPVSCIFFGKPGLGKSNLVNAVAAALVGSFKSALEVEEFKKDSNQQLYNRQPETKYWDGYVGQFVTTFDDLGQMKDVAGNLDNEWMNVIRAINSFEYNLHMADLPKKGTTFFKSKFVLATTNLEQFKPASIISVDAFIRRWDYELEVSLKPEYDLSASSRIVDDSSPEGPKVLKFVQNDGSAKINWKKAREDGIPGMSPKLLRFKRKDGTGDWFFFEELISKLSSRYIEKKGWQKANMKQFDDYTDIYFNKQQREDHVSLEDFEEKAEPQSGFALPFKVPTFDSSNFLFDLELENTIKMAKSYKDSIFEAVHELRNFLDANTLMIMGLAFLSGVILGKLIRVFLIPKVIDVWNYLSSLLFGFSAQQESEIKQLNQRSKSIQKFKTRIVQKQAGDGSYTSTVAETILDKNYVEIALIRPSGVTVRLGSGLFVQGTTVLMPSHFSNNLCLEIKNDLLEDSDFGDEDRDVLLDLKPDYLEYFVTIGNIRMPVFNFLQGAISDDALEQNDLAMFFLKGPHPSHRDITKLFVPIDEVSKLPASQHVTLQRKYENTVFVTSCRATEVGHIAVTDDVFGNYEILRAWKYDASTKKGDCGAVLLTKYKGNHQYILGLHTCGIPKQNIGFAGLVTYEDIQRCLDTVRSKFGGHLPIDKKHIDSLAESQSGFLPDDSQVTYLGRSLTKMHSATETKLTKSRLYDPVTATKAPCYLRKTDGKDPFDMAIAKYVKPKKNVEHNHIRLFGTMAYKTVSNLVRNADLKKLFEPLSFEDAICGISVFGPLKSMTRSTSAGFPYNCDPRISQAKKRYFFGDDQEFDFSSKACRDLKSRVLEQLEMLRCGLTPDWIFVDALKDELKEIEKVLSGKSRLFSVAPIELVIISRMLFGNLMAYTTEHRVQNGFATGVNPYDPLEWKSIREHLAEVSPSKNKIKVGAGDFSGFDASEHPVLLNEIFEVLADFYQSSSSRIIVEAFGRSITNSTHMFRNEFYSWNGSMPSGHPLTTFINNIFNITSFRYCFQRSHPALDFDRHVRIVVQGDDNLWSCSQPVQQSFTEPIVVEYMSELGLVYTSDTKGDFTGQWRTLEEVQFLKRRFVRHMHSERGEIWIAPIATDTLINMPMWKDYDILRQTMDTLQIEWALHGQKQYQERFVPLCLSFREAYEEFSPDIVALRWKDAFDKALSTESTY